MNKRLLLPVLLVALVLFSGCVKINLKEEYTESGVSNIELTMDLSAFPTQPGEETGDPCESMQPEETPMQNIQCSYDEENKTLALTGQLDRSNSTALTKDGGNYRLNVKDALNEFNEQSEDQAQQLDTGNEQQVEMLRSMGLEYNYYVKLPGTMTSQQGGEAQSDGFVKFDLLELDEGDYVESSTIGLFGLDSPIVIFGGLIALIVVAVVLLLVLKKS